MSDQSEPTRTGPPNYAARRMLVSAVVITAIAALGLVAWQVVGGETESVDAIESRWDRIALIDRSAGHITTVDSAGELVAEVTGLGPVRSSAHAAGHLALTGFNAVTIVDVAELTDAPWVVDLTPRSTVVQVPTTDRLLLATVHTNGGDITLVDTSTTTSFDIGELAELEAPLFFADTIRTNPSGTRIAVADAGTFQTILIDTTANDGAGEVTFYPDQPVAVGNELIATSQVRGGSAEIALFGRDGVHRTTVTSALPVGGLFHDDELIYTTVDGQILRVTTGSKEPELLGEVALPAGAQVRSVVAALDGERLIVSGDTFETVVDLDGTVIFTTTFVDTLTPLPSSVTWHCLPVGGGDTFRSLIDLADGEPVADLTGVAVTSTSVDGCTVIGERLGIGEVISANGVIRLPRGHTSTLGPDGTALVWITPSGATQLVRIDADFALTDPIDLSEFTGTNPDIAFVSG
jgi:hypothetical protein